VIEIIPHLELLDYLLEELFEFSNDRESPELGDLPPEELLQPSQMPTDAIDTRQADMVVNPSLDQVVNQSLFYGRDIESVQSILGDCASEDLGGLSPGIDDGTPRDFTLDFDNDGHPSSLESRSIVRRETVNTIHQE
jgi:hypothetical protein